MAKAKVTFHVYDEEKSKHVVYEQGSTVPAAVAEKVGAHCVDKPARSGGRVSGSTPDEKNDGGKPDGTPDEKPGDPAATGGQDKAGE